ncbi:Aste57867_10451 [Aphanomyces stellatus]|uniref:Purple acid phosphatase n=1 Tax=Aphanomyces stellatus TaxID=120398 RepID=A0A485KQH2_9STRA|nr:hypothetical protein As57867_010411 [Aphanomyces stellatus]VFT87325.1 Aste57867_10451 [Aphanomyces stellatus]
MSRMLRRVVMSLLLAAIAVALVRESPWHYDKSPLCFELYASPEKLDLGGDVVVSWTNLQADPADYVTISCGPTTAADDYIQLINVTSTSLSSVRFEDLHMLRCVYVASYFHFNGSAYSLLGQISIPMKDAIESPQQGHLALNDEIDQMVIMYNSASDRTPSVKYGRDPALASDVHTRRGTSTTYAASDMCHAPATIVAQQWFRDPGFMHTIVMDELTLATTYYYQFGNDVDGWSAIYSFQSRPPVDSTAPVKFIAYGDMGVDNAPAAWSTAMRVYQDVRDGYDAFLLHFGDVSYARGIGLQWDKYFYVIQDYATRLPYMVSVGNRTSIFRALMCHGDAFASDEYDYMGGGVHDPSQPDTPNGFHPSWGNYGTDSLGECAVPMFHRFTGPANGHGLFWYSFDYAMVHVIQLSSEHDFLPGSAQYKWLEADLARLNRTAHPWVVVTAHRMMYTTQLDEVEDYMVSVHFRDAVEPLLTRHRVNLVLVGHQHSYERSCPVFKGRCVDQGTVHIVAGSAGAELERSGFSSALGNWSVAHVNAWGYLRLEATIEALAVSFVRNDNGNVYDQTTLRPWLA